MCGSGDVELDAERDQRDAAERPEWRCDRSCTAPEMAPTPMAAQKAIRPSPSTAPRPAATPPRKPRWMARWMHSTLTGPTGAATRTPMSKADRYDERIGQQRQACPRHRGRDLTIRRRPSVSDGHAAPAGVGRRPQLDLQNGPLAMPFGFALPVPHFSILVLASICLVHCLLPADVAAQSRSKARPSAAAPAQAASPTQPDLPLAGRRDARGDPGRGGERRHRARCARRSTGTS